MLESLAFSFVFFQWFYGDEIDFSIKFLVFSLPNEATRKLTWHVNLFIPYNLYDFLWFRFLRELERHLMELGFPLVQL